MPLEKITYVDTPEVTENGSIQVRTRTVIKRDGVEISSEFHRHVIAPGDDYSSEDARVRAICAATHTPNVVQAFRAANSLTI